MHYLAHLLAATVFLGAAAAPGLAQYPTRPVRIIVPFPAAGGVDIVARTVGEKLSPRLKQPVVVENRPGAGTTLGTELAAKSTPDGYTLLVGPSAARRSRRRITASSVTTCGAISPRSPRSATARSCSWSRRVSG
jgi:tripartite-type tricarboxylate transporter receptor subunit TctC